jgi:hypothetical protein
MKNLLKDFEEGETEFFVTKSYIYASFETDRKKEEYHIFYIKKNSNPEAYFQGYMNLKMRRMNKKEAAYFKSVKKNYDHQLTSDDGVVYNLKSRPFKKSQCQTHKQYILSL